MRILLTIEHPAWVHQFHHIVQRLRAQGHEVLTLAVEKDGDTELLKSYGIPYRLCAGTTGTNLVQKGFLFLWLSVRFTWESLRWKPDVHIGRASPMQAFAAWVGRRPHLLYEDTEVSKFSLRLCKVFSTEILTPTTFLTDLGPKQKRLNTYKELFYLHPSVFTPDRQVLREAGFNPDEPYVILRFVAWNASHDVGKRGLDAQGKEALVKRFEEYGKVYVSDEGTLPRSLEPYRLRTPYALVHHVLAFARLVYSEGATMASESAVLGTHALYVNPIVSGTTREMHQRYELLYPFNEGEDRYERATEKARELLQDPDLQAKGRKKQAKLLAEKIDINQYFIEETERLAQAGRKRT